MISVTGIYFSRQSVLLVQWIIKFVFVADSLAFQKSRLTKIINIFAQRNCFPPLQELSVPARVRVKEWKLMKPEGKVWAGVQSVEIKLHSLSEHTCENVMVKAKSSLRSELGTTKSKLPESWKGRVPQQVEVGWSSKLSLCFKCFSLFFCSSFLYTEVLPKISQYASEWFLLFREDQFESITS